MSLRSISVDYTPDFDRSTSGSPPNRQNTLRSEQPTSNSSTTPYTPGSQQKRFNPFLKDSIVAVEVAKDEPIKKPLTPTKEHPLADLSEAMDELDEEAEAEEEEEVVVVEEEVPVELSTHCPPPAVTNHSLGVDNNVNDYNEEKDDGYCESNHNNRTVLQHQDQTTPPKMAIENDENKNCILTDVQPTTPLSSVTTKNVMISSSDSLSEGGNGGVGVVRTALPPGKVVRRKKTSTTAARPASAAVISQHRQSLPPLSKSVLTKSIERLETQMHNLGSETDSSERLEQHNDAPVPEWVVVGESVLIRPYNTSGVISFVGPTHFQVCFLFVRFICNLTVIRLFRVEHGSALNWTHRRAKMTEPYRQHSTLRANRSTESL